MTKKRGYCWVLFFFLLLNSSMVFADLGSVGPGQNTETAAVIKIIYLIGQMQITQEELNNTLAEFDRGETDCLTMTDAAKKSNCENELLKILEKAKMLFSRLNEQAQSIEAEIAMTKTKVGEKHLKKLDRSLVEVSLRRESASTALNARTL